MKRYSLANYIVTITVPAALSDMFSDITIGGQGKAIGSISVNRQGAIYTVKGYATGGYVFDKNLDKTGTVNISINQMSDEIIKLIRLFNAYHTGDYDGMTISVKDNLNNKTVANCIDCMPSSIPNQSFSESSDSQEWSLGCGEINYIVD